MTLREQAEADVHLWLPDALKAARARIADHACQDIPSWFMAAFVLAAAECLPPPPRPQED